MAKIKKPGQKPFGRPTDVEAKEKDLKEKKERLMEGYFDQAEKLQEKNPGESRQCYEMALRIQQELKPKEDPKPENDKPKEKKADDEGLSREGKDKMGKFGTIFTPMHVNDETGELEDPPERFNEEENRWELFDEDENQWQWYNKEKGRWEYNEDNKPLKRRRRKPDKSTA